MPADPVPPPTTADVVIVRWPEERKKASRLADGGVALLYLVTEDDDPPPIASCLADWVRIPGDERDLGARLAALERRATAHQTAPFVDANGCLHYRGALVHLLPIEARLAAVLTDHFGEVVADEELQAYLSADQAAPVTSLRTHVAHLRARLREFGLSISRVNGRGYRVRRR